MTTLAALVENTRNVLFGLNTFEYPKEDRLDGAITDSAETVAVDTAAMWNADDFAEFDDGEVIRFVNDAATSAKRGQRGTTAAAQADNADMVKNPAFFRHQIEDQVKAVVRNELWPHVWTWHQDSLSATESDRMYDLDQYVEEVVQVYQENIDADERFHPLPPGWWDVERQISSTVATNSNLLIIHRVYDFDETVFYTAKRRPHVDDLSNLADEIADMVPVAAAARCIAFKSPQVKQAGARARADDGGLLRDYRALMAEFIRQRDGLRRIMLEEVRPDMRWRPTSRRFSSASAGLRW